jgi:hypothetical protein
VELFIATATSTHCDERIARYDASTGAWTDLAVPSGLNWSSNYVFWDGPNAASVAGLGTTLHYRDGAFVRDVEPIGFDDFATATSVPGFGIVLGSGHGELYKSAPGGFGWMKLDTEGETSAIDGLVPFDGGVAAFIEQLRASVLKQYLANGQPCPAQAMPPIRRGQLVGRTIIGLFERTSLDGATNHFLSFVAPVHPFPDCALDL